MMWVIVWCCLAATSPWSDDLAAVAAGEERSITALRHDLRVAMRQEAQAPMRQRRTRDGHRSTLGVTRRDRNPFDLCGGHALQESRRCFAVAWFGLSGGFAKASSAGPAAAGLTETRSDGRWARLAAVLGQRMGPSAAAAWRAAGGPAAGGLWGRLGGLAWWGRFRITVPSWRISFAT